MAVVPEFVQFLQVLLHETSVQQNTWWLKRERETERDRTEKLREREKEREREREREISMKIWKAREREIVAVVPEFVQFLQVFLLLCGIRNGLLNVHHCTLSFLKITKNIQTKNIIVCLLNLTNDCTIPELQRK